MTRDVMRKMQFGEVRWYGGWGAGLSVLLFLGMALRQDGWMFALDLLYASFWIYVCALFLRLRVIEVKSDALVVTINGTVILDTRRPRS